MDAVEYRTVIKFLYLKGRTPRETFDEIKEVYGEDSPSYCRNVKNRGRTALIKRDSSRSPF